MRLNLALTLALLLAPAPAWACEGTAFAAASLRAASESGSLSAEDKAALGRLATEIGRGAPTCPEPPGARCLGSVEAPATDAGRAWRTLQSAVRSAQDLDAIPAELDKIRVARARIAQIDRAVAQGGATAATRADMAQVEAEIRGSESAIAGRTRAESALRAAEIAWIDAMAELHRGRCASTCGVGSCGDSGRDRDAIAQLRRLYDDLTAADAEFLGTWDEATLRDRVVAGGAGGEVDGDIAARAAWLRVRLAGLAPRPATARAELAFFLAQAAGQPSIGPMTGRKLAQWLQFDRSWRAALNGLDKRIDRMIKAWARVDRADDPRKRMIAADRVQSAMRQLEGAGVAPPPR